MPENIGLVDVDGHNFPNIALMKISAYHKNKGDNVEWANALFGEYDKLYMAKVFTFTKDDDIAYNAKEIIKGGTGYDMSVKLPYEIEHTFPDYGLYGITDTAYGYMSRGCPRGCPFCIVKDKEGQKSVKVADLKEWWNGQKYIQLCDPNTLACPDWRDILQQLIDSKAIVDFNQGVDIRLMTDEKAEMINKVKFKRIHFAWDNPDDTFSLKQFEKYSSIIKGTYNKRMVYVLTNFNSTFEQDLYRINTLRKLNFDPYVMIYEKWNAPRQIRLLQRWCNNKWIFRSCENFYEYNPTMG